MLKISYPLTIIFSLFSFSVYAQEAKEIESITVLAPTRLTVPLSELASAFVPQNTIALDVVFGESAEEKKKIEDGDAGDIFITADRSFINQLKIKGLVDVYSISEMATIDGLHFTAVVVASENMTPARKFLEFIKSSEAKKIWGKNGFESPEAKVSE